MSNSAYPIHKGAKENIYLTDLIIFNIDQAELHKSKLPEIVTHISALNIFVPSKIIEKFF